MVKTSFEQGGIIVATNNKKTHGKYLFEIKKIIQIMKFILFSFN